MGAELCACDELSAEATSTAPPPTQLKIDRQGGPTSTDDGLKADDSRK